MTYDEFREKMGIAKPPDKAEPPQREQAPEPDELELETSNPPEEK